jgi:hypothetical protein
MRVNFLSLFFILLLLIGCFLPWMTVESKNITITGIDTTGTSFGKPAYFHFVWIVLCLIFLALNKRWSQKAALVFAAFNVAWAVRNFFLIPACQMGDCPVRRIGLYLILISSLLLFGAVLFFPAKPINKPVIR